MKKTLFGLIAVACLALVSCGKNKKSEETKTVLCPDGAPYISTLNAGSDYDVTSGADSTTLPAAFASGNYDIIVAPVNLGAKLYKASKSSYKLAGVLTWSNTYLASQTEIKSLDDITTIEAFGQGTVNQAVLDYVCAGKTINYSMNNTKEAAEKLLKTNDVVLIAEPSLSTVCYKNPNTAIYTISIEDLYSAKTGYDSYPQAGLFVKADTDADKLKEIKKDFTASTKSTSKMVTKAMAEELFENEDIAQDAINGSHISFMDSAEAKPYIETLANLNLSLFGGVLPVNEFYI